MKKRLLFLAKDRQGNVHNIDNIDKANKVDKSDKLGKADNVDKANKLEKANKEEFFCPHCSETVVPKMGEQKVWHFAHKDRPCKPSYSGEPDKSTDSKIDLDKFGTTQTWKENTTVSPDFLCFKCKKRFMKQLGLKWEGNEYICRACYDLM